MIHQLDREEVQDWLKELSERDRKVLMLRYSGYSYSEIADHLEVRYRCRHVGTASNNTVKASSRAA